MDRLSDPASASDVQVAADLLIETAGDEEQGADALELFSAAVLDHFRETTSSTAKSRLFSPELPFAAQRFSAAWLIWILSQNRGALNFGDTERLTASLCDRAIPEAYPTDTNERDQTFEKLQALERFATSMMNEARQLIERAVPLDRIEQYREDLLRFFNRDRTKSVLEQLLPAALVYNETQHLLNAVVEYARNRNIPTANVFDSACEACINYKEKATEHGSKVSQEILVGLASNLLGTITQEEEKSRPHLSYSAMEKRYPFKEAGSEVTFYVTVENTGTGPARDLKLTTGSTVPSLDELTDPTSIATFQAGDTAELIVTGTVRHPSDELTLELRLSWRRNNGQNEHKDERFIFRAQKDDVDWNLVRNEQPYDHTAPVTSTEHLYGRRDELNRLVRAANAPTVGSAYLFGQKRVGKTSLANALAEQLNVDGREKGIDWIVVYGGSGDYVMSDAVSTLTQLGRFLFNQIRRKLERSIPNIMQYPVPDFTKGLAPLSTFIDHVLDTDENDSIRMLFILDEFDELPMELLRRTELATALFQPIRQISTKPKCGFLLVGGENIGQLMVLQGDRLNKFEAVGIDYLNRPEFSDLIREPVKHWLTITSEALEALYESCSGNPFYAKLLAAEIRDNMVAREDSNASRKDVEDAIDRKTRDIPPNSFAHFWMDGILPNSEEIERIQTARRFVLTAASQLLKDGESLSRTRVVERAKRSRDRTLLESDYFASLDDLHSRRIIVGNGDYIDMKMPLFKNWLMQTGGDSILPDSTQRLYVNRRQEEEGRHKITDDEIFTLCSKFDAAGRKVEPVAVRGWLSRFGATRDQRLMFDLLQGVTVYGRNLEREKLREAFGIVTRDMPNADSVGGYPNHRGILASCLDESPAKGGVAMCRLFAEENGLHTDSFVYVSDLFNAINRRQRVQRLVLIDDFAGTGGTLERALASNLETLKRANSKGIRIIIIAIAGFVRAQSRIAEFIRTNNLDAIVHFCDPLGEEYMAFSDRSRIFPNPNDRERAKDVAEQKGVALFSEHPLGYQNTQALVVFDDHCPNNSLPILWSDKDKWPALFPRRGV